jgi:hypothetical protein
MTAPPMPFLPAEVHGELVIMAMLAYAGEEVEAGQRAVSGTRRADRRHGKADALPGDLPPEEDDFHPTAVARTKFIDTIDRDVSQMILERHRASDAPMRVAQIRVLGGAMARVSAVATAFAHRSSRIMVNVAAFYEGAEERAAREAWVSDFAAALEQGDGGVYVNFLGDEGEGRVRAAYPGSTWDRLIEIKSRYDPTNFFRLNQNISPAIEQ